MKLEMKAISALEKVFPDEAPEGMQVLYADRADPIETSVSIFGAL